MSTLSFERGTGFMAEIIHTTRMVDELIEFARTTTAPDGRRPIIADDEYARRLAVLRAEVTMLRSATYRAVSRNIRQGAPGPEGSMLRLYFGELSQRMFRLAVDMMGPAGLEYDGDRLGRPSTRRWLRTFASTIGGGTSEINRNIIGERVLGLPRG